MRVLPLPFNFSSGTPVLLFKQLNYKPIKAMASSTDGQRLVWNSPMCYRVVTRSQGAGSCEYQSTDIMLATQSYLATMANRFLP